VGTERRGRVVKKEPPPKTKAAREESGGSGERAAATERAPHLSARASPPTTHTFPPPTAKPKKEVGHSSLPTTQARAYCAVLWPRGARGAKKLGRDRGPALSNSRLSQSPAALSPPPDPRSSSALMTLLPWMTRAGFCGFGGGAGRQASDDSERGGKRASNGAFCAPPRSRAPSLSAPRAQLLSARAYGHDEQTRATKPASRVAAPGIRAGVQERARGALCQSPLPTDRGAL